MKDEITNSHAPNISGFNILSQIADAVIAVDFEGRVLFWNKGAERLYGRTAAEMAGQPLPVSHRSEWLHGEDEQKVLEAIRQTGGWSGESFHLLQDGRRLPVESEVCLFRDDNGREIGLIAVVRDATAKRQRELQQFELAKRSRDEAQQEWKQLRGNDGVLENFLENLPACAYVKDERGRYLFHNKASKDLAPETVNSAGKTDEELFGPETSRQFRENDLATLTSGKPTRTIETVTVEGKEVWLLTVKFPLQNANGNRFIGGVSIDISDGLRDQTELRKQAALLDLASDAIFISEVDGPITYWNRGAERLYGWTVAEALGKHPRELLKSEFASSFEAVMKQFQQEGHWEGELMHHGKQGEPIIVSSRWSLLRDPNSAPVAAMAINTDVTVLKMIFAELQRAEAEATRRSSELAAILDAIPGATFIAHDPECKSMTSSRIAYELLRLPYGANSSKSAPPEERPTFRVMQDGRELPAEQLPMQRAAATGVPVTNSELTIVFDDGTSRDLYGNAVPLKDAEGKVRGAVGAFVDVTERKRTEAQLALSEGRYRALVRACAEMVWTTAADGNQTGEIPEWHAFTGQTPEQAEGLGWADAIHPDDREHNLGVWEAAVAKGAYCEVENRVRRHDGVYRNMLVRIVPVRNAAGEIVEWVGMHTDITEQKLSEEKRKLSEGRYRSLVRATSELVWTGTPEGLQISDLPEWQAFTGQSAEQTAGFGWADAIHPEDRERTVLKWKEAVAAGTVFEEEQRLRDRHGSYHDMLVRAVPVRDDSGNIVEWVGMHTNITEQRNLERALRQSTNRYRKLFESDLMGIGIPNRFGAFTEANEELLRIIGYTREDLEAGRVRWDLMTPPEYAALDAAHITEAAQRGSCTPYEKEYIRKDGSRVPILCGYALLEGSQDEYIGFVQDLSAQKQVEAQLRQQEAEFRLLANSISQLCWMAHGDGNIYWYNQRWYEYTGTTLEEMQGWGWQKAHHSEFLPQVLEGWRRSIASGERFEMIFPLRRADGVFRTFLTRVVPLIDEVGRVQRWFGTNTDITAEREAALALAESERRFRVLAESLPQLIWVADSEGANTYCNQRFLEYTGMDPDSMMGMNWEKLIHSEDLASTVEKWRRSLQTGEDYTNEYRLRRHDGEYRCFLARAVPVRNEAGQIERWLGSSTEIHDQKVAEEALRRSEKLAAIGRLAASLAHEINNPLAAVTNALYLGLQEPGLSQELRQILTIADQQLVRVAHVTTQMLRFHRQSTAARLSDAADLMNSAFTVFDSRFRAASIAVERDYRPCESLYCYGDELRQVFASLIGNALDATPRGGKVRIRIRKAASVDGTDGVKVVVADTGHGVPPQVRKRIFEPFVSTKDSTGIGLGLWISEGIVRKHGGRITLRSRTDAERHGTVISLFLPLHGMPRPKGAAGATS